MSNVRTSDTEQIRSGLQAAHTELCATIARVDDLTRVIGPAEEPGDDTDRAALAVYHVIDGLCSLDAMIRRVWGRL